MSTVSLVLILQNIFLYIVDYVCKFIFQYNSSTCKAYHLQTSQLHEPFEVLTILTAYGLTVIYEGCPKIS